MNNMFFTMHLMYNKEIIIKPSERVSMNDLHWPLTVLSRAIHYKNITASAASIGLSQPQISRLIQKLENHLQIRLIDKSSPRNSSWTPQARQLAQIYERSTKNLETSLGQLKEDTLPKSIRIASLEGLAIEACGLAKRLFEKTSIQECYLDVFDQDEMEARFLTGDIDLMYSSRIPGMKKGLPHKLVGHQRMKKSATDPRFRLFSPFEYSSSKKPKKESSFTLISNSLTVRAHWLDEIGGVGQVPGPILRKGAANTLSVLLIAQEYIHPEIWKFC
jgi:hypothetical protein